MLEVGSLAPEIDTVDQHGRPLRLSEQVRRLCAVLYFFPKAFTPGCTRETEAFRDNYNELHLAGASVIGVSTDDGETQCRFADSLKAPFPMLSDPNGQIAAAYDVRWPLIGLAKRVTYIVDPSRRIVAVFHHEVRVDQHQSDVLRFVDELFRQRRDGESSDKR